ncbi:MAG: glucosamine-6-phosphate deaminase [Spirochaetes bacterium]|nr:glucosamine-6-phosphate deaminase [Spirochaetota bacterium]
MNKQIFGDKAALGEAAAEKAIGLLRAAIQKNGRAVFIAATGASQFEFLAALARDPKRVDWDKTTLFHLDEYVGIPETHGASFRKYLKERFISKVRPKTVHLVAGDAADPMAECKRLGSLISKETVDVAFVGIGENGHLAFNDPPADFTTREPYLVVALDEACRRQQMGEGWFKTLEDVPKRAISMSVNEILRAKEIICCVPDRRKAKAVHDCLSRGVSPDFPASILQRHGATHLFLDKDSASMLAGG